jgi:AcrR family transcriptional regulator
VSESAQPRRERGYAKGRATRVQIVEAAMVLFGEVGYRSASLREIASRVGISHPGLIHHFPTKEVLLAAVLEHRDAVDDSQLSADLASGTGLMDALVRLVRRNAERPGIVELFTTLAAEATAPDHPAHRYFRDRYATTVTLLTRELETLRADGALRPSVEPGSAARALTALMDGLQVQWLIERGSEDQVDMAAVMSDALDLYVVPGLGSAEEASGPNGVSGPRTAGLPDRTV